MSVEVMECEKTFKTVLPKRYSHCPLKKRPVQIFKDDVKLECNDSANLSEPENLSTKPEDLSVTNVRSTSSETSQQALGLEQKWEATAFSVPQKEKSSGRVLEPLNLNTSLEISHPIAFRPTPRYPLHYVPFAYHYGSPDVYHPSSMYTVPVERIFDETLTSGGIYSSPARPLPSVSGKPYVPYSVSEDCALSPTFSSSSRSSEAAAAEDLSSPGSVASTESTGSTGMGNGKRRKDSGPRYRCPDCDKSYSTYSGLSKHQQFHCAASETSQAKKSFSCKFCPKVYVSLGALKMHIRTHTLPCKCTVCGKAFSRPWLLQGHVRTHTGEKPFSCQHCGRAFADRSNLRAHLQTHSDVKKYSCTTCSKTFSRMSLLTKHTDGGCPGVSSEPIFRHARGLSDIILPQEFHR